MLNLREIFLNIESNSNVYNYNMFFSRQNIVPFLLSVSITVGIYFVSIKFCATPNFEKFFELFITAFSILVGFLFTIATILNNYRTEKLDFIIKSGGMTTFYSSLKKSIYSSFIAILLSMVYFLFKDFFVEYKIVEYFVTGINILAMIFSINFTKFFLEIVLDK